MENGAEFLGFLLSFMSVVGMVLSPLPGASAQGCPLPFSPSDVIPSQAYNYSSAAFEDLFATLNTTIDNYSSQHGLPTYAVVIVHENRTIFSSGLTTTPFRIASISKTITSLGAFMLREQGLLLLDDPVKKFLPDFSIINPFGQHDTTLRELMGHAAGFPRELCPMLMTCTNNESEILQQIAGMELISSPWGDTPAYSNLGIAVLGRAWEKATSPSMTWEEFVIEKIAKPLGMNSTGVNVTDIELAPNTNPFARQDLGWSAPAAQMYSTADDLAKYMTFLLKRQPELISDSSMREWFSPATIFGDGLAGYSFPWELQKLYENSTEFLITKSGNINGFRSHIAFDPPTEVGVVVLTVINPGSGGAPEELADIILRTLIATVQSVNQDIIAAQYAGVYNCTRSEVFKSPNFDYTVQVMNGTIIVSSSPTLGLLADVDISVQNAGLPVTAQGNWALLLKNATENSFWFGGSTNCWSAIGGVSAGADLDNPNTPGSLYTNVLVFDPPNGSVSWPAVGGHCYKTGFAPVEPSKGPRTVPPRSPTSFLAGAVFSLLLFFFVF